MIELHTWFWVSIVIMIIQAIAVVILSGGWGVFLFAFRRYAYQEDVNNLRLILDANAKRITALEAVARDRLTRE